MRLNKKKNWEHDMGALDPCSHHSSWMAFPCCFIIRMPVCKVSLCTDVLYLRKCILIGREKTFVSLDFLLGVFHYLNLYFFYKKNDKYSLFLALLVFLSVSLVLGEYSAYVIWEIWSIFQFPQYKFFRLVEKSWFHSIMKFLIQKQRNKTFFLLLLKTICMCHVLR